MDDRRFDALARRLSIVGSRRHAARVLAGGLTAGLLVAVGHADDASALGARQVRYRDRCKEKAENNPNIAYCPKTRDCVNTATDPKNCGACYKNCGPNATCASGECKCNPDFEMCDGRCGDPTKAYLGDPDNCGACGNPPCPSFSINGEIVRGACCNGICSTTGPTCSG